MISRVRSASFALLAMLAVACPCPAAEGMAPGNGGVGGQLGGSLFWADGDYSQGAMARVAFEGHFRYVSSKSLRWQFAPGFTWAGYSSGEPIAVPDGRFPADDSKKDNLTLVLPATAQLQYLIHQGKWHYHVGVGLGFYRVWVENHRQVLVDPISLRRHRGIYPGVSGQIGVERFLAALPSTSLELTVATHWVRTPSDWTNTGVAPDAEFPVGYNSNLALTEVRIGGSYYFDLGRFRKKEKATLPGTTR